MQPDYAHLPIYRLSGLRGNAPAQLDALQQFFAHYLEIIHAGWWMLYAGTLAYLITRFIVLPLLRR